MDKKRIWESFDSKVVQSDPHPVGSAAPRMPSKEATMPGDPEHASRALLDVQELLQRYDSAMADSSESERISIEPAINFEGASAIEELKIVIGGLHPADTAYVLEALPHSDRMLVWSLIEPEREGYILLEISESARESLIRSMNRDELVEALEGLDAEEIAELAPDLPVGVVGEVQQGLSREEREQLRASLSYPEDSVGVLMDFDAITVCQDVTLDAVLYELRLLDALPEHTDQVFVVDAHGVLVGGLALERILINQPDVLVLEVMRPDLLRLHPFESASHAAQAFERYDLVSAPVVDPRNRVIGRVKVSDVLDVIREEGDLEVLAKAGLREEEDLFSGVWASARNRWLWLLVNLCTAFFSTRVISVFEGVIAQIVALAALLPVVAGMAGNSGNQTMTLIIRSMALGQVNSANMWGLVKKELYVTILNGVVFGGGAGLVTALLHRSIPAGNLLGLTMGLAIFLNLAVGALVGVTVPLILQRLGRDPALGSSVLLTFSTDSMGFLIFLGLAALFF